MPSGDLGDPVEAEIGRVGAHTVGEPGQALEVVLDLARVDAGRRVERVLSTAERGVGDAVELFGRIERRPRHVDRQAKPPPRAADHGGNGNEQT